ncbi:hypothetical protein CC78DRAFT_604194 [Lojkania enalia]|uniref:EGF-like domain-containing protein n=1 Tax=Lojkania enalia TaxID=147567 RepID=A0A9P4TQ66_9PLEO|nr:hypothetical protein CC78DRAFT_604194 [Didymosphaeria enalia]
MFNVMKSLLFGAFLLQFLDHARAQVLPEDATLTTAEAVVGLPTGLTSDLGVIGETPNLNALLGGAASLPSELVASLEAMTDLPAGLSDLLGSLAGSTTDSSTTATSETSGSTTITELLGALGSPSGMSEPSRSKSSVSSSTRGINDKGALRIDSLPTLAPLLTPGEIIPGSGIVPEVPGVISEPLLPLISSAQVAASGFIPPGLLPSGLRAPGELPIPPVKLPLPEAIPSTSSLLPVSVSVSSLPLVSPTAAAQNASGFGSKSVEEPSEGFSGAALDNSGSPLSGFSGASSDGFSGESLDKDFGPSSPFPFGGQPMGFGDGPPMVFGGGPGALSGFQDPYEDWNDESEEEEEEEHIGPEGMKHDYDHHGKVETKIDDECPWYCRKKYPKKKYHAHSYSDSGSEHEDKKEYADLKKHSRFFRRMPDLVPDELSALLEDWDLDEEWDSIPDFDIYEVSGLTPDIDLDEALDMAPGFDFDEVVDVAPELDIEDGLALKRKPLGGFKGFKWPQKKSSNNKVSRTNGESGDHDAPASLAQSTKNRKWKKEGKHPKRKKCPKTCFRKPHKPYTATKHGHEILEIDRPSPYISSETMTAEETTITAAAIFPDPTTLITSTATTSDHSSPAEETSSPIEGLGVPPLPPPPPRCPRQCNPFNPLLNKCDITTTCVTDGGHKYYCACRAGYRLNYASPWDTSRQFHVPNPGLNWVYVGPEEKCDKPCNDISCSEVKMAPECV